MRGTFANVRLRNKLRPGTEGGVTRLLPEGHAMSHLRRLGRVREARHAALHPRRQGVRLRLARATGPPRGRGCSASASSSPRATSASTAPTSSAWASCRCSSSPGQNAESLQLTGEEVYRIGDKPGQLQADARQQVRQRQAAHNHRGVGPAARPTEFPVAVRIDTPQEILYYQHGGILQYVLRQLAGKA